MNRISKRYTSLTAGVAYARILAFVVVCTLTTQNLPALLTSIPAMGLIRNPFTVMLHCQVLRRSAKRTLGGIRCITIYNMKSCIIILQITARVIPLMSFSHIYIAKLPSMIVLRINNRTATPDTLIIST